MGAMLPLFLKSNFARNVFWEICFCVIIQDIRNFLGPGTPRKNNYNLASSGYGYCGFPLAQISS